MHQVLTCRVRPLQEYDLAGEAPEATAERLWAEEQLRLARLDNARWAGLAGA